MWALMYRRTDGSFVINLNEYPYHVVGDDPMFPEVAAAAEGFEFPQEPTPPSHTAGPLSLTARQLRLGLIGAGVTLTSVTAAIEALNDPAALVEWEYATVYERNHPLVVQIGTTLGLTANQVDTLWAQAFTL